MEKKVAIIGHVDFGKTTVNAIEACANSNDTVLIQSNERGIEIINIDEIKRSPFAPEPTMIIKNYRVEDYPESVAYHILGGQKKFRKKNNRKHKSKRK